MRTLCEVLAKQEFNPDKREWRKEVEYACRHGVFFDAPPSPACPCLSPSRAADWSDAVLMPALNSNLKCIVTDAFDPSRIPTVGMPSSGTAATELVEKGLATERTSASRILHFYPR